MIRLVPLAALLMLSAAAPPDAVVLAEVNGRTLTDRDLASSLAIRGVPANASPAVRDRALAELIDRELIRGFLTRHKVEADAEQLAVAVRTAKERLAAGGKNPDEAIASLGFEETGLAAEVALPLAWQKFVGRTLTEAQIKERFEKNRRRFDGTRLRVAQIFLRDEPGGTAGQAPRTTARLAALREEIVGGKTTFAAAAEKHSQAPTKSAGGEVGWITTSGDLPAAVSDAAYRLDVGGVSEVVTSRRGAHLVSVLEVEPGELSLEDARPKIVAELSRDLWAETVAAERKTAKITMTAPAGR